MAYESVIGRGHIRILDEEEKLEALKNLWEIIIRITTLKYPQILYDFKGMITLLIDLPLIFANI